MRSLHSSVNVAARRPGRRGRRLLALAYYLAYVLRFDAGIPDRYEDLLADTIVLTVAMKLVIFALFGLYSKLWRFVDQKDFEAILKAVVVSTRRADRRAVPVLARHATTRRARSWRSTSCSRWCSSAARASPCARSSSARSAARSSSAPRHEVLIVGAGNGGQQVAFELRRNPGLRQRRRSGFVDDDPRKQGMRVAGPQGARHHRRAAARARRRQARRGDHRDPLGAGHPAPEGGHRLPRARHPGAHAAHHLRAALRRA